MAAPARTPSQQFSRRQHREHDRQKNDQPLHLNATAVTRRPRSALTSPVQSTAPQARRITTTATSITLVDSCGTWTRRNGDVAYPAAAKKLRQAGAAQLPGDQADDDRVAVHDCRSRSSTNRETGRDGVHRVCDQRHQRALVISERQIGVRPTRSTARRRRSRTGPERQEGDYPSAAIAATPVTAKRGDPDKVSSSVTSSRLTTARGGHVATTGSVRRCVRRDVEVGFTDCRVGDAA